MDNKFARGRSSEIFKLEDGKILKLFFKEYPIEDVEREYKNTIIASKLGCTPIKVYERIKKENRNGFVMSYCDGICQNDMPGKNPLYIFKAGYDLAKCHALVHSKKSHELEDIRKIAIDALSSKAFDDFTSGEKEKIKKYILSLKEEDTVIHLDFHTGNVLVNKKKELFVIDWMTAARGSRYVEYAMMNFLFKDAELFPEKSKFVNSIFGLIRGMIGKQYYKMYEKLMPVDQNEVDKYRIIALIIRRSWLIEFEHQNLVKQIKELISRYC